VTTTMTDEHGSANGAHGGVGHLLRMAKTQCGVSLAFAALRKADGGFAIATFPALTSDPTWTIEAIDELVRQTWDDPHLGSGTVLVRTGRVLRGMWAGQSHHIKLAAAALSDAEAPEHPWGLLCVAEPLAGHFEQDQLNLLGNLAARLTSYLRARQQVLEGAFGGIEPTGTVVAPAPEEPPVPESLAQPVAETPFVEPVAAPVSPAPQPTGEPVGGFEQLFEEVQEVEHPLEEATGEPIGSWGMIRHREARSDDWTFLELDEIDWIEATEPSTVAAEEVVREGTGITATTTGSTTTESVALEIPAVQRVAEAVFFEETTRPEAPVEAPRAAATAEAGAVPSTFGTREAEPVATPPSRERTSDLDAMLGPDPVTGLPTLATLVGRLSTSLAHVRNHEGAVGLILVDVSAPAGSPEVGPTALMTVAGRLANHLRDRDLVARIGASTFAVLVDLRPGAVDLDVIQERSLGSLSEGTEASTGGLRVRSAMASAGAGSTISAEELLRQAADQLQGR